MSALIVGLPYFVIISVILYYYFCRLCHTAFLWYGCLIYTLLACGLAGFQYLKWLGEFPYVLIGILILAAFCAFQKREFFESFALSSLTICIYSIITGIMQSLTFWIMSCTNSLILLKYIDSVQNSAIIILIIFTFRATKRFFANGTKPAQRSALPVLVIPILFITLVEAFLSDSVYGNSIVWDTEKGLVFPVVNNAQLLIVRLLACGGLFSALVAYQKLLASLERDQMIQLLKQQMQVQEVYIREATSRYEQTRSFRHDLKNHLLILHQLLKVDKPNKADEYLGKLEVISDDLSFPVKTGNTTVDALLGSKLAIAAQKNVEVDCSLRIPEQSGISDLDWCIILSNALDNAINASECVPAQDRCIQLSGTQKGNVFLLHIENCCQENTKTLSAGIGLSNIKAVLQKYNGKLEIETSDRTFWLDALLIIPHHSGNIPHQFY